MAKVFKGFKQVTAGSFEGNAENGYIYFVRNSANTGATDGYLQFNGKKYGTAAELEADVNAKIGTLPEGYDNLVDYIDGQLSAVTDNFSSDSVTGSSNGVEVEIGQADGNVTAVTVTAPDFANTYAGKSEFESVSGVVDTINSDYLKTADKTELNNAITAETAAREALADRVGDIEAISADTRLDALEAVSAATRLDALEAVDADTRLDALEAVSADTRLDALEALTASTSSALRSISAGDASVSVGTKDSNKNQTVAVARSAASGNALSLNNDGLFAAVYYDGDDSD